MEGKGVKRDAKPRAVNGSVLSVVIPAYNEENGIATIVERVLAVQSALKADAGCDLEVVVVDDGSRDRTAERVGAFPAVKLVRHPVNRGYGAALKTGFYNATGDLLAFLDADGTYPPESLPQMCNEVKRGADLVIGSRMAGARSEMPPTRRIGNVFFATMLSLVGNRRVTDSASGMRVFRRDVLRRLYPLPDGLNFTPVMSTRAIHEGIAMVEVPIPYRERIGRSKLSVVRDGMRFLNSIIWTALSYNPARILGAIGFGGVVLAAVIILGVALARLAGVAQLDNWGIFAVGTALITAVAGVSLFNLGAMFNYLVALFQKDAVQQGLFGKPIFNPPLDRHFWWMGGLALLAGLAVGVVSLVLSFGGWDASRLWLWLLGAAMLILVGVQLVISWIVMRVLDEVAQRDQRANLDMIGQ